MPLSLVSSSANSSATWMYEWKYEWTNCLSMMSFSTEIHFDKSYNRLIHEENKHFISYFSSSEGEKSSSPFLTVDLTIHIALSLSRECDPLSIHFSIMPHAIDRLNMFSIWRCFIAWIETEIKHKIVRCMLASISSKITKQKHSNNMPVLLYKIRK